MPGAAEALTEALGDRWADGYRGAAELERPLMDAVRRCVVRWGLRKTTLEDIAREAGVGRATVYRAFPGGKERLADAVLCHEVVRLFEQCDAALSAADTLDELVVTGVSAALGVMTEDELVRSILTHEPELVLPRFAFHQLDRFLDVAAALCRPHLSRFLPPDAIRPGAELLARVALTFGFRPPTWFDVHDPDAVRRLVRTYLVPAITPAPAAATPTPADLPEEHPCPPTTS
jgi:AcrR family transcriptional regulator